MSLILEALKKLERDKQVDDRGFLVMAAQPWQPTGEARGYLIASLALTAFALALVTAGGVWWWRQAQATSAAAAPSAPAPAKTGASVTRPATVYVPPAASMAPAAAKAAPGAPATAKTGVANVPPASEAKPAAQTPLVAVPDAPVDDAPAPLVAAAPKPTSSLSELRLTATARRDGRPVAILNDRMVYEGDVIDGIKVLHIDENSVEVEVGGEKRVLSF